MGEVTVPAAPDPDLAAIAELPAGARRGVVILHELLGRQPEIDRVVARLAAAGYAAVAPDLYSQGPRLACVRDLLRAAATGEGRPARAVLAARRWLCGAAGLDEQRVGLIGLCIGGGFALSVGRGWPVVSANYGAMPPAERLPGIGAAIVCYGGRDRIFARNAEPLRKLLEAAGVPSEVHVFPTVGHSFLTDGHHPVLFSLGRPILGVGYDPVVAEAAWARILDFFDHHLSP